MVTLRQLVISSYCLSLLGVFAASSSPQAVRGDGGLLMVPPALANSSGGESPNHWAPTRQFHVGQSLDFGRWNGSVLLVNHRGYELCIAATPLLRLADGGTSPNTITLDLPGSYFFIGGSTEQCRAGQRRHLNIVSSGSSTDEPRKMAFARDQPVYDSSLDTKVSIAILLAILAAILGLLLYDMWSKRRQGTENAKQRRDVEMTTVQYRSEEAPLCEYKEGGSRECEVCYDEYVDGDRLGVLSCKHSFHEACILEWVKVGAAPCPICRVEV